MGADITVAEMNQESAQRTADEVKESGRRALAVGADVTRAEDRKAMVDQTVATFNRIDILVNNAGIYRAGTPLDITEEHWDAVMGVNARAVFFCAQAVLPSMLEARRDSRQLRVSRIGGHGHVGADRPRGWRRSARQTAR